MSNNRIKVAGYSQTIRLNNQIEWRPFSPDLVGVQLASNDGTPLFTMGNFSVTTNFDPKKDKTFNTNSLSNFVSLSDIGDNLEDILGVLVNNSGVILNLDKKDLTNYSLFGSFREYVRVGLENIIINWPAALYISPIYQLEPQYITQSGYTFENYTYDSISNISSFCVSTNVINNKFQINYNKNGILENSFSSSNDLRNITLNYLSYVLFINGEELDVIGFTGSTTNTNDTLYFSINGNPFTGNTLNGYTTYYIKPNKLKENLFYNKLSNFESYLLNRSVTPKFTSNFKFTIKSDAGDILYVNEKLTWPVSDGYNIDFNTEDYSDYATRLLEISTDFDLTTSNLVIRFLVTESITDFDTTAIFSDASVQDDTGQKMNKTLNIYGVEFDNINSFIKGIQFANTVTYDKANNTPDIYLKNLARVLGWDLISSVIENNILNNYLDTAESTYSGQTVGLTPVQADIELWRRIILNTPWIWKSKGTRKAVEFLFKFIGTPTGLINFNEYIYLAENKIDVDQFIRVLEESNLSTDLNLYPVSLSGYPSPFPNTSDNYFQGNGLWYRETGGDNSTIDITTGNNPHAGPYDRGFKYINQFRELIPDFSAVTLSSETVVTTNNNLFTNYNLGTMTKYSGATFVDITTTNGVDFSNCYVVNTTIELDPKKRQDETNCGCDIPEELRSLSICVDKKDFQAKTCYDDIASVKLELPTGYYNYNLYQYNMDGTKYTVNGVEIYNTTNFIDKDCCSANQNTAFFYEKYIGDGSAAYPYILENSGYICCKNSSNTCGQFVTCDWKLSTPNTVSISGNTFLVFETKSGRKVVVSKDGSNCVPILTNKIKVIDPNSNTEGYGCKLTNAGIDDINSNDSVIINTYSQRFSGELDCGGVYVKSIVPRFFGVVINKDVNVNTYINNIEYVDITSQTYIGYNFNNSTIPLSGFSVGYFNDVIGTSSTTPNKGDMVRLQIRKDSLASTTLAFEPTLGDRMYYLVSNTLYTNDTIKTQLFTGLNMLSVYAQNINNVDYYCGNFIYNPLTTPIYVYMVLDFSSRVNIDEPPICQCTKRILTCVDGEDLTGSGNKYTYKYSYVACDGSIVTKKTFTTTGIEFCASSIISNDPEITIVDTLECCLEVN
jgi:hypothetical protein